MYACICQNSIKMIFHFGSDKSKSIMTLWFYYSSGIISANATAIMTEYISVFQIWMSKRDSKFLDSLPPEKCLVPSVLFSSFGCR